MSPINQPAAEEGAQPLSEARAVPAYKEHLDAMPKLGLEANSRILIRFNPLDHKSQPLQGQFIGLSHYEFLIIRMPMVPGVAANLVPRSIVELRYFSSGAVHSCHTEILTHTSKPALLVFTSYPDRLTVKAIRKERRLFCALPIAIHTSKGDAKGIIRDLSLSGCRVSLELTGQSAVRGLVAGEEVVVQTAFDVDMPTGGAAFVRSVKISGSRLSVGLSFAAGQKEFLQMVESYMKNVACLLPGG